MPSDKPDDMNNPAFSPRQVEQLDETIDKKLDSRGFNARQLEQLDEILDNRFEKAAADLDIKMLALFEDFRTRLLQDMRAMNKTLLEDSERNTKLTVEGITNRVEKVENENLPARVTKLEEAVFPPPKPPRRRRG